MTPRQLGRPLAAVAIQAAGQAAAGYPLLELTACLAGAAPASGPPKRISSP